MIKRCLIHSALTLLLLQGFAHGLTVNVELDNPVTPFHRPATLSIVVEAAEETEVSLAGLPEATEDLDVSQADVERGVSEDGVATETHQLTLDAKRPTKYIIQGLTVNAGDESIALPPLVFEARELSEIELDSVSHFVGLAGMEVLEEQPLSPLWLGLIGLVVLLLAGALVYWWRTRPEAEEAPKPPAWEVAQVRLRELGHRKLPEHGKVEAYYVDLTAILRYYIEDRFSVHAPEQTTDEFLAAAAEKHILTEEQESALAGFLKHCDRVKFARYVPSLIEMNENFGLVENFIHQTIPQKTEEDEEKEAAA